MKGEISEFRVPGEELDELAPGGPISPLQSLQEDNTLAEGAELKSRAVAGRAYRAFNEAQKRSHPFETRRLP